MPPRSRKGWKAKADKLWSEYVRTRDKVCRRCGKVPSKHPHHIVSRRYHATRFMPANGVGLCPACHFYCHQNPIGSHKWLVETLGQKHLDALDELSKKIEKLDYTEICRQLETQLNQLKG